MGCHGIFTYIMSKLADHTLTEATMTKTEVMYVYFNSR